MHFVRPAGLNELRCIARDNLKLYGSIVSVAEYTGPHKLEESDFVNTVAQCVNEHPALKIVVQDADTESPKLAKIDSVDLGNHCFIRPDNDSSTLDSNHGTPFTECLTRPQWFVVVQPNTGEDLPGIGLFQFRLTFACSHNLVDGMSGPQFHETFLRVLHDVKNSASSGVTPPGPESAFVLPPPLEKAGKLAISWSFLLGPLLNEYLPASLASAFGVKATPTGKIWIGALTRPNQLPLTNLVSTAVHQVSINPTTLRSVLAASKLHDSRLTSLVSHLTARALARALNSRGQEYAHFISSITINMRKALNQGEGQMANYPSSTEDIVAVQPRHLEAKPGMTDDDWETVAATTKRLQERSSTLADQPVGLLSYLSDFRGWTKRNASAPAKVSFEISNVGIMNGSGGDWQIKDLVFSQSADASGPPFSVNLASIKGGKLNFAFAWCPGALGVDDDAVFIKEVAADVVRELEHVAAEHDRP